MPAKTYLLLFLLLPLITFAQKANLIIPQRQSSSFIEAYFDEAQNTLFTFDLNGETSLWNTSSARPLFSIKNPQTNRYPCDFNFPKRLSVSAGRDFYAKIWDLKKGELLHEFQLSKNAPPSCFLFSKYRCREIFY